MTDPVLQFSQDQDDPPEKLRSARVMREVVATLERARRIHAARLPAGCAGRECTSCLSVWEVSWRSHDLYTLALDLAEDDIVRGLVGQARTAIALRLMR